MRNLFCTALISVLACFAVSAQIQTPQDIAREAFEADPTTGTARTLSDAFNISGGGNQDGQEEEEGAETYFRQQARIRSGPKKAAALFGLGHFHRSQHMWQPAFDAYLEASLFFPYKFKREKALCLHAAADMLLKLGRYEDAIGRYGQSMALREKLGDQRGVAQALNDIGVACWYQNDLPRAMEHFEKSYAAREELGDKRGMGAAITNIGLANWNLGRYPEAMRCYEKSIELEEAIGHEKGVGDSLNNLGALFDDIGDFHKALAYYQKSLILRQSMLDREGEAATHNTLGVLYWNLGDYGKALEHVRRALTLRRETNGVRGEAQALSNLGMIYKALGDYERARGFHEQSLALCRRIEDRKGEADSLSNLGVLADRSGDSETALVLYKQSLKLRQDMGDKKGEALSLNNIGMLLKNAGEHFEALEWFEESLALKRGIGDGRGIVETLSNMATCHAQNEYYHEALDAGSEALSRAQAMDNMDMLFKAHYALGQVHQKAGTKKFAARHYFSALETDESMRSLLSESRQRSGFLKTKLGVYEALVSLLVAGVSAEESDLPPTYESLLVAERMRARSFLEEISKTRLSARGAPSKRLARQQLLKARIQWLRKRVE